MGEHWSIIKTPEGEHYECEHCDFESNRKGDLLRHHNPKSPDRCPVRDWEAEEEEKEEEEEEGPPGVYRTEPDLNRILRDILDRHPDIPEKVTEEVMSWAEYGPIGPTRLAFLLQNMKGISKQTASVVAQKFSLAIQRAQREGRLQMPVPFQPLPQQGGQQPSFYGFGQLQGMGPSSPGQIQPQQRWRQQPTGQTPFVTREELAKMNREREEQQRIQKLEEKVESRMNKLDSSLASSISRLEEKLEKTGEPQQQEVVEIPIDGKGNPCPPKKAVSIKRVTRPAGGGEDVLDQMIKMKKAGLIGGEELTADKVRNIIRQEGKTEEPKGLKDIRSDLKATRAEYQELKETMQEKEKKRVEAKIDRLDERIDTLLGRPAGEFKSDEMRVIAQGLADLKDLIKGRKPMDTVENLLSPQGARQPMKPGKRTGIIDRLREKGMTVRR